MRNHKISQSRRRDNGFTLIEVMVAVVIFSIGLLGVAGLQTSGLKTTHQSYQRTVAITAARDMADRMRANITGVRSNAYNFSTAPSDPGCVSAACTAANIANHDASQWYASLTASLPSPSASSVSCTDINAGTPALDQGSACIITVRWDSERSGVTGTGCSTIASNNDLTCVQLRFIP
jgi:type IV pilus assembly protein PilV